MGSTSPMGPTFHRYPHIQERFTAHGTNLSLLVGVPPLQVKVKASVLAEVIGDVKRDVVVPT